MHFVLCSRVRFPFVSPLCFFPVFCVLRGFSIFFFNVFFSVFCLNVFFFSFCLIGIVYGFYFNGISFFCLFFPVSVLMGFSPLFVLIFSRFLLEWRFLCFLLDWGFPFSVWMGLLFHIFSNFIQLRTWVDINFIPIFYPPPSTHSHTHTTNTRTPYKHINTHTLTLPRPVHLLQPDSPSLFYRDDGGGEAVRRRGWGSEGGEDGAWFPLPIKWVRRFISLIPSHKKCRNPRRKVGILKEIDRLSRAISHMTPK